MLSFKERELDSLIEVITLRLDKFATQLELTDIEEICRTSIRVLNEWVNHPRILLLRNPARVVNLEQYGVDSVAMVKFSNDATLMDPFISQFGLLPLLAKGTPINAIEGITEFLIMKGNLNALSRHMKTAPDWEYYPPEIIFNGDYNAVCIEYLPYLDADYDKWVVNDLEWSFLIEHSWALANLRANEALMSGAFLGVDGASDRALTYWNDKLNGGEGILASFKKSGVQTYLG